MSEKTMHTPGPWVVTRGSWSKDCNAQYELEGVKVLQAADARLIAAAPDLLEALQDALFLLWPYTEEAKKAVAAIAKATGEKA